MKKHQLKTEIINLFYRRVNTFANIDDWFGLRAEDFTIPSLFGFSRDFVRNNKINFYQSRNKAKKFLTGKSNWDDSEIT